MHALPTIDSVKAKFDQLAGMMVPVPDCYEVGCLFRAIASDLDALKMFRVPPQDGLSRVWSALLALEEFIECALIRVRIFERDLQLRKAETLDEEAAERLRIELQENLERREAADKAIMDAIKAITSSPHRKPGPLEKRYGM